MNAQNGQAKRDGYTNKLTLKLGEFAEKSIVDSSKDEIYGLDEAKSNSPLHAAKQATCNVPYNEKNAETTYIFGFMEDLKKAQKERDEKAGKTCKSQFLI